MNEAPPDDNRSSWYEIGLRFRCHPDCGHCCVNHEDYAYVYLQREDVGRLAEHLGLTRRDFLAGYTIRESGLAVLRMDRPECVFLDGSRCTVYEARPVQCRTFPFWRENVESTETWSRLRGFCPGIDDGEVHSADLIQIQLDMRRFD